MTIKTGDKIPSVKLKRLGASGMEEFDTAAEIAGKKVVLFGLPGAFTPPCSQKHLPGYLERLNDLKAQGIDMVICVAVNDPFVMKKWSEETGAEGKIAMWPDGNATFADALGLHFDGSGHGLGKRFKRFSMLIENGTVKELEVEDKASDVEVSSANACVARLQAKKAA